MGGSSARVSPEIGSYVRLDHVYLIFEQGSGSPSCQRQQALLPGTMEGMYLKAIDMSGSPLFTDMVG